MIIFAAAIYAQRPFAGGISSAFSVRAVKANDREHANLLIKDESDKVYPKGEGWAHQHSLVEIPIEWINEVSKENKQ